MKRIFWVSIFLSLSLSSMAISDETEKTPCWKLSIAIPESNGVRAIQLCSEEHFHVILENTSKQPRKIWKESNSWGYSILHLELTDNSGKKHIIRKRPKNWRKNVPGYWSINSEEHLVFNVDLKDSAWEFTIPRNNEAKRYKIQAIIDIPKDSESIEKDIWSGEKDIWSGSVKSPLYDVNIYP